MSNMLTNGMSWLQGQMTLHCSVAIEYRRGDASTSVSAVLGKTDYETSDDNGFEVGATSFDFMVTVTDLGFEPGAGDIVAYNGRQFQVMTIPGQGEWRFTDATQGVYRIHTRHIGYDS